MGLQPIPFNRSGIPPRCRRPGEGRSVDYMKSFNCRIYGGAGEGNRTPDLLITSQLLYQLSYASASTQKQTPPAQTRTTSG